MCDHTGVKIATLHSPATAINAGNVRNSWVLPEQKVVFVSIGKNACTSIKWLLAEISGQDIAGILGSDAPQSTRRMLIHRRSSWKNTPRLVDLDPKALAEIGPENGWFVFAVVRDPRLRIFSAWQSKFLVGDPLYCFQKHAGRHWLPRTPESPQDVLEDWQRFILALENEQGAGGPPFGDGHFAPHTARLHEDVVPYSRIYEISELSELTADLEGHLRATTGSSPELALARENDTPLSAGREVYENGIRERIEKLYASDFERFGDLWSFEKIMSRPIDWTDVAMRDIAARRAINERVADLNTKLADRDRRVGQLTKENARLRREVAKRRSGGHQPNGTPWHEDALRLGKRLARGVRRRVRS